jgi:hypothetical protein
MLQGMNHSSSLHYLIRRNWSRLTELATYYSSALAYRSSGYAWRANGMLARAAGKLQGLESAESAAFAKVPFAKGCLPAATLECLRSAILSAPDVAFCSDDHAPGYQFNPGEGLARGYNDTCRFHRIGETQASAIAGAINDIAPQITRNLGSGWRIVNVRGWSLRPGNTSPADWHVDGFPPSTFKLMIYLTPIGREDGTTEIRHNDGATAILEGDAGVYLLFDPNTLWHRAIPPARPDIERTIIEVTLMRAPFTDQRLACAGLNSSYPFMPWAARPLLRVSS